MRKQPLTSSTPDNSVLFINFADSKPPDFKEVPGKDFIAFGDDNKYPDYLLYLYNKSSKHNAIINGKFNYIYGKGLKPVEENDVAAKALLIKCNRYSETINDIAQKCVLDIEIFSGCYTQVIWGKGGKIVELYHLPFNEVRKHKDGTGWLHKKDWTKNTDPVFYPNFDPEKKQGAQVIAYKEYRPGTEYYPLPGYLASCNYIETDIEISKYHLSSIRNGMFPSKMIIFNTGEPTEEGKRKLEQAFRKKFAGAENSGRFMMVFNTDPSKAPIIQDLSATELDKQFTILNDTVQQEIFSGHSITTPALFGIASAGKLGESNQLQEGYDIFKNTYAEVKQSRYEEYLNYIVSYAGSTSGYVLQPLDPIGFKLSEAALLQVAPKEWLLEKAGIDITKYQPQPQPAPAAMKKQYTEEEVADMFSAFGDDRQELVLIDGWEQSNAGDYKFYETSFADVASVTEANIIDLIKKDKRATPEVIARALGVSREWVARKIGEMVGKGLLEQSTSIIGEDVIIERKPLTEADVRSTGYEPTTVDVFIRYTYEKKPEASGPSIIPTTRPFCKKLVTLSKEKMYSRADIEQITQRVGYSVFDRTGGFWTQPDGSVSPSCRHYWKTNIVIRKRRKS